MSQDSISAKLTEKSGKWYITVSATDGREDEIYLMESEEVARQAMTAMVQRLKILALTTGSR